MAAKDYANTRFSGLDEINAANVAQLKLAWTFSTGSDRGHEAVPIVVGNTLYLITPIPHTVFALEITPTGASTRWSYQPPFQRAAEGVACCDVVNRGVVYSDGRIFFNTLDNQTIALDAASGRPSASTATAPFAGCSSVRSARWARWCCASSSSGR